MKQKNIRAYGMGVDLHLNDLKAISDLPCFGENNRYNLLEDVTNKAFRGLEAKKHAKIKEFIDKSFESN